MSREKILKVGLLEPKPSFGGPTPILITGALNFINLLMMQVPSQYYMCKLD
jgi:hypothetical protein